MSMTRVDITTRAPYSEPMAPRAAFPLRFHDERVRTLVRELAEREHISQNEFIERAVEREVILRGELVARDLAAAAERLTQMTEDQHRALLARSHEEFGLGEALPDPVEARALHQEVTVLDLSTSTDPLGVLAAFDAAAG